MSEAHADKGPRPNANPSHAPAPSASQPDEPIKDLDVREEAQSKITGGLTPEKVEAHSE
jgi:hypothetical protein